MQDKGDFWKAKWLYIKVIKVVEVRDLGLSWLRAHQIIDRQNER